MIPRETKAWELSEQNRKMDLVDHAYMLLTCDPELLRDAQHFNTYRESVVAMIMSRTTGSPRWMTEDAVRRALLRIERKTRRR
jgi:hypothetical protein